MGEFIMPPGQKPSARLYPISIFGKPKEIDIDNYFVKITGLIKSEKVISLKEIFNMNKESVQFDIHCVDGWSYLGPVFSGVYPKVLFEDVSILPSGKFVMVKTLDGYSTDLPLDFLLSNDAFLAYEMDGKPLDIANGYPLRLVVNGKYEYKDAKWVVEFEVMEEDIPGYWEKKGYSRSANVYENDRFEK
jgi:DMSO/TMAO reductase YedYZ molybdopterin-dependent catalytic subunit